MLRDPWLAVGSVLTSHWRRDKLPCSKLWQFEMRLLWNPEPVSALGLPDTLKFSQKTSRRVMLHPWYLSRGRRKQWDVFAAWWTKVFNIFWASPTRGTNISHEIYAHWSLSVITGKLSDLSLLCKHFGHHVYFDFRVLEFRDTSIIYGVCRIYWHCCNWLAKLLLSYFLDISGITVLVLSIGTSWVRN